MQDHRLWEPLVHQNRESILARNERFWVKFHFEPRQGHRHRTDAEAKEVVGRVRPSTPERFGAAVHRGRPSTPAGNPLRGAAGEPPLSLAGNADRYDHRDGNDDASRSRAPFTLFDAARKMRLFANNPASMGGVPKFIALRQVAHFEKGRPKHAEGTRAALARQGRGPGGRGDTPPFPPGRPNRMPPARGGRMAYGRNLPMKASPRLPQEPFDTLAAWGTDYLARVIAIDSQSDEESKTIPSSDGQRRLSDFLRGFFEELGFRCDQDAHANLMVSIPSNLGAGRHLPAVALMVHMDTSEGTMAVPALVTTPAWDGSPVRYPENDRLAVTVENYPATRYYLGEDLLHGPGRFPIGLDDKLGMAELMTLARVLRGNPELPHGDLLLVFRPDEEIGRMEAVEGLADELAKRGVTHGYTIDGLTPFEINVENFNASRGRVTFEDRPLRLPGAAHSRRVTVRVRGVNTHGATAKAEGYRNATVIVARAVAALGDREDVVAADFRSDPALECNAEAVFLLRGPAPADLDAAEQALLDALGAEVRPHAWKGATAEVTERAAADPAGGGQSDAARRLLAHLATFLATPGVHPMLSEDSDGYGGYSNPHFVQRRGTALTLDYRFRDFDPEGLSRREEHLRAVCRAADLPVEIEAQYVNMGPELAKHPELVAWAEAALAAVGQPALKQPIRGGTGVDPFLTRGIPVANLGTGYFAPESEKELTSRQNIARHALWLAALVQVIAARE